MEVRVKIVIRKQRNFNSLNKTFYHYESYTNNKKILLEEL